MLEQEIARNPTRNEPNEKYSKRQMLPEKKFEVRNSLLTDLFENNHIKTIYHLFGAIFIGLFINTAVHDYIHNGEIRVGLNSIKLGFRNVHKACMAWILLYSLTCLTYVAFQFWTKVRFSFPPKSRILELWDKGSIFCTLLFFLWSFRLASYLVCRLNLPPPSAAIVVLEQVRFLMKIYAFIRSNVPKVIQHKTHSDRELVLPEFRHFLYFTFAPTLVYRDEYPRTKTIRYGYIFHCFLEIIGVIFYYAFVFERYLKPALQEFGLRKYTKSELILLFVESSFSGVLLLLGTFYLLLHSVQNLFAELLTFGDRLFYKDWWQSTSYSGFFRTWNVVVYNWLYTYIYKDMLEIVAPKNKILGKLSVLVVSALAHEWILTSILGFFMPVVFIEMTILSGVLILINVPKLPIINMLFWYSLALGNGFQVCIYLIEYYARLNVPKHNETVYDFFVPRCLTCDCIV